MLPYIAYMDPMGKPTAKETIRVRVRTAIDELTLGQTLSSVTWDGPNMLKRKDQTLDDIGPNPPKNVGQTHDAMVVFIHVHRFSLVTPDLFSTKKAGQLPDIPVRTFTTPGHAVTVNPSDPQKVKQR